MIYYGVKNGKHIINQNGTYWALTRKQVFEMKTVIDKIAEDIDYEDKKAKKNYD